MKTRYSLALATLLAIGATPAIASSVMHDQNGQVGYPVEPNHTPAGKSRAQVQQELDAAKADRRSPYYRFQYTMPVPPLAAVPGKSREQIQRESGRASATEQQRLNSLYGGA